jgi:hypothetical protein
MDVAKLRPALAERLRQAAPGETLEIVLELQPRRVQPTQGLSVEERTAPVRDGFAHDSKPVEDAVAAAGGAVLGRVWLNQTIRVRVPAGAVPALSAFAQVVALDLPRTLVRG